jgi:uncharacterized protein (DUF1778 family)
MPSAAPTARLEARISTELHAMLKRAAEMQGRSLTDFVVSAVQEAAQRAIEQGEVVRLSLADSERFAQALLSPPDPSPALERAFARRCKLLRPTLKAQVKTPAFCDPSVYSHTSRTWVRRVCAPYPRRCAGRCSYCVDSKSDRGVQSFPMAFRLIPHWEVVSPLTRSTTLSP